MVLSPIGQGRLGAWVRGVPEGRGPLCARALPESVVPDLQRNDAVLTRRDPAVDCHHGTPDGLSLTTAGTLRCALCRAEAGIKTPPLAVRLRGVARRARVARAIVVTLGTFTPHPVLILGGPMRTLPVVSIEDGVKLARAGKLVAMTCPSRQRGRAQIIEAMDALAAQGEDGVLAAKFYRSNGAERIEYPRSGGRLELMPEDTTAPRWRGMTFDAVVKL